MQIFLLCCTFGIISGVVFELFYAIRALSNFTYILTFVLDLVAVLFSAFMFVFCVYTYNSGIIRLYLILAFLLGIFVTKISLGNLVAKFVNSIYNYIIKLAEKRKAKATRQGEQGAKPR